MLEAVWVCRDGRKMKVAEMETTHIMNSILKIKNSGEREWRIGWLPILEAELTRRLTQMSSSASRLSKLDLDP